MNFVCHALRLSSLKGERCVTTLRNRCEHFSIIFNNELFWPNVLVVFIMVNKRSDCKNFYFVIVRKCFAIKKYYILSVDLFELFSCVKFQKRGYIFSLFNSMSIVIKGKINLFGCVLTSALRLPTGVSDNRRSLSRCCRFAPRFANNTGVYSVCVLSHLFL